MTDGGFEALLRDHGTSLLRLAYLLTGDRGHGEDLLQDVLERAFRGWSRIERTDEPVFYVRRSLVNAATSRWRRLRARVREVPILSDTERNSVDDMATYDLRDALVRVLNTLPARQRAVLVLRYWHDLSEAEIAETLSCSIGAVKSSASRGLAQLRKVSPALDLTPASVSSNPMTPASLWSA